MCVIPSSHNDDDCAVVYAVDGNRCVNAHESTLRYTDDAGFHTFLDTDVNRRVPQNDGDRLLAHGAPVRCRSNGVSGQFAAFATGPVQMACALRRPAPQRHDARHSGTTATTRLWVRESTAASTARGRSSTCLATGTAVRSASVPAGVARSPVAGT